MTKQNNWKMKFFIIAAGQAVSLIGSSAVQFALIWRLAEQTASPMVMGISGLMAFLPMTFLSPFAGVAADRYNRKAICITADMSLGILALLYSIMLLKFELPVWAILMVLFLRGVGGTFHQPAFQSIIPQLVPTEYLVKVNGWSQLMMSGSFILGPVVGAAMYAAFPLSAVLLSDFVGAVAASISLGVVAVPRIVNHESQKNGFMHQLKEGVKVYVEDKPLLILVAAETLCMIFFMPLSSFYPLMTSSFFNLSAVYGSIVEVVFAGGMLVTAALFGSVLKVKNKKKVSYIGLIGVGVSTFLCGLMPPVFDGWIVFTVLCGFMGAFGNVHSIPLMAYMQETIPPEKMGRAFSLLGLAGSLTMPLGLLVAGPVAEKTGVHIWFVIAGIGVLLSVLLCLVMGKLFQQKSLDKQI